MSNQRLTGVVAIGCRNTKLTILDSAVISSRSLRLVDCENVEIICEDTDLRRIELFRCRGCSLTVIGDDVLLHVMYFLTREGCANSKFFIGDYGPAAHLPPPVIKHHEASIPDSVDGNQFYTYVPYPEIIESRPLVIDNALTPDGLKLQQTLATFTLPTMFGSLDQDLLFAPSAIPTGDNLLAAIAELEARPYTVTQEQIDEQYDNERREFVEEDEAVIEKARSVAQLLRASKYCVVYTGAGVSTSAQIPDFRGPSGVWTLRDKGETRRSNFSITDVKPTFAHYAITELVRRGMVKFVVTTNYDGLHWRTGLPLNLLEELHGCAFSLYCPNCGQFFRRGYRVEGHNDFHVTSELCSWCGTGLVDTGVAFSEGYRSPLEPVITRFHAEKADLALVLGTSMCVQSAAMYPMQVVGKGNLVLVNIQHTPVDDLTNVRIFAKTDDFFRALMRELQITQFDTKTDVLKRMPKARPK
jgi:NAD-dependent SIR2 family protein deacetylase